MALTCHVVAAGGEVAPTRAMVRTSGHLQEVDAQVPAQLTFVALGGPGAVDWDRVGALAADPLHGQLVLCTEVAEDLQAHVCPVRAPILVVPQAREAALVAEDDEDQPGVEPAVLAPQPPAVAPPAPGSTNPSYPDLSQMESKVVFLISTGATNLEIAERLFLSLNTVKTYIRTAYRKMGVTRRSQAVAWALTARDCG